MTVAAAPHRAVVHLGAPKSGTTFLQRALWRHQDGLREAGFICAGRSHRDMFAAAVEVRETWDSWGFREEAVSGTWHRLCRQAREFDGTTILSHEILSAARADQAARALEELAGLEVHLVFTARDLGRQVLSEWQERVKNGSTQSFAKFHRSLAKQMRDDDLSGLFWRHQNVLDVLDRWGPGIPADRVHVVPAPRPGADPRVLWQRFGEAVGFDADAFDPTTPEGVANQSLGTVQISVLRRVNKALDGRIVQPAYAQVVKRQFAQRLLPRHTSDRPVCPPELLEELRLLSEEWIRQVDARGYAVHGDLTDLLPETTAGDAPAPDDVDPRKEAEVAAALVADLLVEAAGKRSRPRQRRRTTAAAPAPSPVESLRERLVRRGRGALRALPHR